MRAIALRWVLPVCLWSVGAGAARVDAQDQEVEVMRAAALHLRSSIPDGTPVTVDADPQITDARTLGMILGGEPAPVVGHVLVAVAEALGADLRPRDAVVRREERGGGFISLSLIDTDRFVRFIGPVIDGDEARVYIFQMVPASLVEASGERRAWTVQSGQVMHLTRSPEGWRFDRYGFGFIT